jgi:PAS domain S-box-containing protein
VLFDNLFEKNYEIEKIKAASNKLFNILNENLAEYKKYDYPENSIMKVLINDNELVKNHLSVMRDMLKELNKDGGDHIVSQLLSDFGALERYTNHYTVMENVVFPEIEKAWKNHQCLKLMWSFHDDIRKNIKSILNVLKAQSLDLRLFNQLCGRIYFNIHTIIYREENILFQVMFETMDSDSFDRMSSQLGGFKLEFAELETSVVIPGPEKGEINMSNDNTVKFSTGELSLEQLELILNHLPVDITFVDENDKVRYFSAPAERLFPRTSGIIGRKVQDCHPHESADVVSRIVASFKSGEKDNASFWLKMGQKYILIKYFAVRDSSKNYKGVLEVSQEISDIQTIKGERRLLDWE